MRNLGHIAMQKILLCYEKINQKKFPINIYACKRNLFVQIQY